MMTSSIAVDTNVLIYLHDKLDERKRTISENILVNGPKVSSQVISEYINVTRRLLELPKTDILILCAELLDKCDTIRISQSTLLLAASLSNKYNLQIFDSIIVAAALESNCSILYSEDMHHGLSINKMTIVNPFV